MYSRKFLIKTALLTTCFAGSQLFAKDFSHLKAHWNFDEGRDWHNMEFPYNHAESRAQDWVGENDLALGKGMDTMASWVSGRQYSGIKLDGKSALTAKKSLDELGGAASVSYWIKTKGNGGTLLGNAEGLEWGALTPEGKISVKEKGKSIVESPTAVNDGEWHHVAIIREAKEGKIMLYVDGKPVGNGVTTPGEIKADYKQVGMGFDGVLDQVHVFDAPIQAETVAILVDNCAPKVYDQNYTVTNKKPTVTGSILHLYTYDTDIDKLKVSRFTQPKNGKVSYNNDGTFTFIANPGFNTVDEFDVTLTDGKGGYDKATVTLTEESMLPQPAVVKYKNFEELNIPGSEEFKGHRVPKIMDIDGDGKQELLILGNNKIWVYTNKGAKAKPEWATPVELKDSKGQSITTPCFDLVDINGDKALDLIAKQSDGTFLVYENKPGKKAVWTPSAKLKNSAGEDLNINEALFAMGDFNNNGLIDLVIDHPSAGIILYKNTGDKKAPQFATEGENVIPGSYNFSASFVDLNKDGKMDLIRGENWGGLYYYLNKGGETITKNQQANHISLEDKSGNPPMNPDGKDSVLRSANGSHCAFADINGDGVLDIVLGAYSNGKVYVGYGVHPNMIARNLNEIEKIYDKYGSKLGLALEADNKKLLERYKQLNKEWVDWARNLPTLEMKTKAYNALKAHVKKYPFLQRQKLDGGKMGKVDGKNAYIPGPMHHVPSLFTQNWVTLHCLLPDSAAHRLDVADTLGLKGLDREQYLSSGKAVADNNTCSPGQLQSIKDMFTYHAPVLFPDDHISIDNHFGDGREGMSYVFVSNKNTFGSETGSESSEWGQDCTDAAVKVFGPKATTGDYFTFVMAHEVCHSLDAYVYSRKNQNLLRRWREAMVYAANNGGEVDLIASDPETGYWDVKATQEKFKAKGLWNGTDDWGAAWENYWKESPYVNLAFMRGNVGWFLGAIQETLATQANHHWAGSESRIVGAIDRFDRGFKSNLNEVVHYLDVLSAGQNKLPMYRFNVVKDEKRVDYIVDYAWLERNDQGYITRVTIKDRVYKFDVDDKGIVKGYETINVFDKPVNP